MRLPKALAPYLAIYRSPRIAIMVLFGFASGLPLALTGGTLQVWMTKAGVDLRTIGIFSLLGLPYTLKFLWSPFMDRFVPPWLGRRRGWMLPIQLVLSGGIVAMGFSSPEHAILAIAALASLVAFSSASQDIVIDAYRTDLLHQEERGAGTATFVIGYRIGMLVSGALALVLSDHIGWRSTYLIMAGFMVIGMIGSIFGPEPQVAVVPPKSMNEAVWGPLKDFFSRRSAAALLLAIVLYKLGDAYAGTLTSVFLIITGFSASEVGTINKGLGLVSTLLGAAAGGTLMVRLGLFRSLLAFGVLQLVSNLSFMVLAWTGKSYPVMVFAVAFENLCGGMGTAAFVAFLMSLCNKRFTATQFALLSSLAVLGRVFVAPTSGYVVKFVGWANFFLLTAVTAVPGLLLLYSLRDEIKKMVEDEANR
jgi:PAT family beta-lactamase induction signal transducer AmpG